MITSLTCARETKKDADFVRPIFPAFGYAVVEDGVNPWCFEIEINWFWDDRILGECYWVLLL